MSLESVFKLSLIMNMVDNLSGPMAGIASRVGADVAKLDALSQTFGATLKAGIAMQEMGSQITSAVLAPVEATFETRRALGNLASLGVEDMDALESAARSFSDQWSGTTKAGFISAAYDIKSGISSLTDEGVAEFTSLAALTAKATQSTASEMTSLFATGYGIYKNYYSDLSDIQFGEMFSAGISESVRAFKTSGSGMAQSIQTLGASATTANVPLEEQLAVLGMLQATMGGSEAGTKYKAFLQSAAKAGEALGLEFLDANNQLKALPEILSQLQGKFGETMDAAEKLELQQAFGTAEAVSMIDLFYSKTGDLQDNILNLYSAMGQGTGAAEKMASAIQETEPERYERLHQRIQNVTESIGSMLLPAVNDLLDKGEQVLTKAASWIEENEALVKTIMMIVLGLGLFLTAAGTVIAVVSGVGLVVTKTVAAFKILKAALVLAKGALAPLIGSVWSFTAALLANPVTWVVIGILALIAALVLLYNKCEWFRDGVGAVLNFLGEKFGAALETVKNVLGAISGAVSGGLDMVKAAAQEKLDSMQQIYEEHGGGVQGVIAIMMAGAGDILDAGFSTLDRLTGGGLSTVKDTAARRLDELRNIYEAHGGGIQGAAAVALEGVGGIFEAGFNALNGMTGGRLDSLRAAYESHGGGAAGIAAAAFAGVKGVFAAGYNALDDLTGGKLTEIGGKFSEKLATAAGITSSILDAAAVTVSEKLENMRTAYESHGGGIQGTAAAAIEGVKGFYTAGFTFLDTLTGGKLSEIKGSFDTAMSGIVQGVGQKFTEAEAAFMTGLDKIKNVVTGAVTWFFDSGKKIVSTFASGISSAFSGAVDAVQGGLQRIRNFLPFSDAKEGPLSTLTLSGQRTMTTYAHGLTLAQDAPAEAMEQGLRRTKAALEREPVRKISLANDDEAEDAGDTEAGNSGGSGKQIIIQNLIMQVDLKKMKDLQQLLNILKEIEDYVNGSGTGDPDMEPSPA